MANEAIERILQNALRIIILVSGFTMGFLLSSELTSIIGRNVPVIYKDFPVVFLWAALFLSIAYLTAVWSVALSMLPIHESIFTKVCRWCCIVSFALAVFLLLICRLLSSAFLIGSDWAFEELGGI